VIMKFYAGIGSRETPPEVLAKMEAIAKALATKGYTLRSGGATGADKAFEKGAVSKEILYANMATKESIDLALTYHPNPTALKAKGDYVLGLMGRNMQIILGRNLDSPVDFVVCWTKDGGPTGGTGQALRYCMKNGFTVYNLFYPEALAQLRTRFSQMK
jgi:hypothetical protein